MNVSTENQGGGTFVDIPLCIICGKKFKQRKNLYDHTRNVHKKNHNYMLLPRKLIRCPICDKNEINRQQVYAHITAVHNININFEKKIFKEINDFNNWKEETENNSSLQYVLERGFKRLADQSKKQYYHCSRSGDYERDKCAKTKRKQTLISTENQKNTRPIKTRGTKRIGKLCPATMEVRIYPDDHVEVLFWSTHMGHGLDLHHCNLSKVERATITGKLSEGVSLNRILDDVRGGVLSDTENFSRVRMLTRKDLNNLQNQLSSSLFQSYNAAVTTSKSNITKLNDNEWHVQS